MLQTEPAAERRPRPEGMLCALFLLALLLAAELTGWKLPFPPDLHLVPGTGCPEVVVCPTEAPAPPPTASTGRP